MDEFEEMWSLETPKTYGEMRSKSGMRYIYGVDPYETIINKKLLLLL